MNDRSSKEIIHGYEIKRSIIFEDNRGFALGNNPNAVDPFVVWRFSQDTDGKREYFWGRYMSSELEANKHYETCASWYGKEHRLNEAGAYKYYSTMRPVDIGTFPKAPNGPIRITNYDMRVDVEADTFKAWGYLIYDTPLTEKQISDYELRPAPGNPDVQRSHNVIDRDAGKNITNSKHALTKPIAEQLKESAEQAAIDNAERSAMPKSDKKGRGER